MEMAEKECNLADTERIDFVSIVTPNRSHFDIARTFLESGFHVICDKPMTCTLEEARILKEIVERTGRILAVTYTYTGYPMVKQARHIVQEGFLGDIVKVVAEYRQAWVPRLLDTKGANRDVWRFDPSKAGISCCIGDIGIHAQNLIQYITGLKIEKICADLFCAVPEKPLDNDGSILLRFNDGSHGIMHVSQLYSGEENGMNIQIYGTKQGLSWRQENPNYLKCMSLHGYSTTYSKGVRGSRVLSEEAVLASRLPLGHPEGFIEALANIYLEAFKAMKVKSIADRRSRTFDYPGVDDGVVSMAFIESVIASATSDDKWTQMIQVES
jgi:predicted dehydrogenase